MINDIMPRLNIESSENWRGCASKIPELHFKPEWGIIVIPPFSGAMARFIVKHNGKAVSVYLDFYDNLGMYGSPYWEIYPIHDDIQRYDINDTEGLLAGIEEALNEESNTFGG